jgi:hypothetical protein
MPDTLVIAESGGQNTGHRFSWGLAIAGGVCATAVTFFILTLGSGFGLFLVRPLTHSGPSLPVFLTGGAIYFMAAQAFGFAVGGHVAGRFLGPLIESRVQEELRAAAHGLVAWAVTVLATLTMVVLAGMTAASTSATTATLYGTATGSKTSETAPTAYMVDVLFRPSKPMSGSMMGDTTPRGEAGRIIDADVANGEQLTSGDHDRLVGLVAAQTGLSVDGAAQRVDAFQADLQAKTRKAADVARKTASYASLWIALSLLFGAMVAMLAAVVAREEDDRDMAKAV